MSKLKLQLYVHDPNARRSTEWKQWNAGGKCLLILWLLLVCLYGLFAALFFGILLLAVSLVIFAWVIDGIYYGFI